MKINSDKVESCVLVAEVNGSSYYYNVDPANIESGIKTIVAAYDTFDEMCSRVYISGFNLVSRDTNLSKEELIKRVAFPARQNKRIREIQSSAAVK